MEVHTCSKCNIECPSREAMKEHFTSHFHSTNLSRVANKELPFTLDQYNEMLSKSSYLKKGQSEANSISCKTCKKSFMSQGSYETHCRSKKHRENLTRKAAENIRRLQIQLSKSKEPSKSAEVLSVTHNTTIGNNRVIKGTQYCMACKESFTSEKAYEYHSKTFKHKKALKLIKLSDKRKANLAQQDKVAEAGDEDMEVEEVDSDEWDEDDGEMEDEDQSSTKAMPLSVCIFCSYKSTNLTTNIGHMERTHSFFLPHKHACDLEAFYNYLGEKVGLGFECIDCNKSFEKLTAVQKHMLDKPHMSIRFEGEYDKFFDIKQIMARVQLPVKVPEKEWFAFPLPDGSVLTHRNLRRYFRQRIKDSQSAVLTRTLKGYDRKAIGHLGKMAAGPSSSLVEIRKEQKRMTRDAKAQHHVESKQRVAVGVKANKLQPHFRLQVQNAG